MVSSIKQLPTPVLKFGAALVCGLLPAIVLAWFVYGIVGGIAYFQGWSVAHLFVWIWLALSVPGLLPGSLRETAGNMSLVIALAGFLLPLPAHLHRVFPVQENAYVPDSYTPAISYSAYFTEPHSFPVFLVLGLGIGFSGLAAYIALTRSETNVEPKIEDGDVSGPIIGTIKNWFAFLLKLVISIVLATIPSWVLSCFVTIFEEGNPFRQGLGAIHFFVWIWVAVAILGVLPGSLKETMARMSLLTGLAGVLLPCAMYLGIVSGGPQFDGVDVVGLLFFVILYMIFFGIIGGGGLAGYIALTHPGVFASAFAPASQAPSADSPQETPPTDCAAA